jgi:hypothetical protein
MLLRPAADIIKRLNGAGLLWDRALLLLPILKYGSSTPKAPGKPLDFLNSELEKIVQNGIKTMRAASGVGLAANEELIPPDENRNWAWQMRSPGPSCRALPLHKGKEYTGIYKS